MDLRLLDAEPTLEERAAVDAVLGRRRRWAAGSVEDGHAAHGGHDARAQRHLLLPALHALQSARAGSARAGSTTCASG